MYAYISTLQHGRSLSKRGVITTIGTLKSNFQNSSFSKAKKDKYFIRPKNSPPSNLLIQQGAVLLRSKALHCFSFEAMRRLPLSGKVKNLASFFL
jgi:threonyl-tRNA synthetase